jgi:acyl-coenzyme A thioesterase PaaI-like protein
VLHGGAILGFLDTILGHVVVQETGKRCATVALDGRFVAAAPPGTWISGRVTARKVTRSLAFLDAEATAGDTLLVTATAIFRVFDDGS